MGKVVASSRKVGISQFVILEHLRQSLIEGCLLSLQLFYIEELLSGRFNSESSVSEINPLLSKRLFEFGLKVLSYLRLWCRVLVDPEAHLVRELFIVKSSGKHGLLNQVKLYLLSPFVRLEVTGNLVVGNGFGEKFRVDGVGGGF